MTTGKIAAQCGHAVMLVMWRWAVSFVTRRWARPAGSRSALRVLLDWLRSDYRKVVLKADDKEFEKAKAVDGSALVVDNGYTEVDANTETVVGLWPMRKSERPKWLARLRAL